MAGVFFLLHGSYFKPVQEGLILFYMMRRLTGEEVAIRAQAQDGIGKLVYV